MRCTGLCFLHLFVIKLNIIYLKLSDEASEGLEIDSMWFRYSSGSCLVLWSLLLLREPTFPPSSALQCLSMPGSSPPPHLTPPPRGAVLMTSPRTPGGRSRLPRQCLRVGIKMQFWHSVSRKQGLTCIEQQSSRSGWRTQVPSQANFWSRGGGEVSWLCRDSKFNLLGHVIAGAGNGSTAQ